MAEAKKGVHKWSPAQTKRLIRFRAENEERFLKSKASAKQWKKLIKELGLQGKVSSQQVSKKYKELKTPCSGGGTDEGQETATTWQYYEDMHAVLGGRAAMDPPLLVDACAEGDTIIQSALNVAEPSTSDAPCTATVPAVPLSCQSRPPPSTSPSPKRRKSNPILDYLVHESEKEQKRHEEMEQRMDRFLALFERMVDKMCKLMRHAPIVHTATTSSFCNTFFAMD
ncbi:uncharacterized protein LOC130917274 isoform X2 [Corythoichthys intestinalis]|uniref:uncharacterized protein LOC130917274 isoform X2 n=1 Tax=Corythoichthys intestinalis TaxID=161448 RepID=UPI0025A545FD|nr:uncharacterized protein LOC130917274 isoform X2 [Corythoichthys intestinalis]